MPGFPKPAKEWRPSEIEADCAREREEFRKRRLAGPLNDYLEMFPSAKAAADQIVASLPRILASPADQEFLAEIVGDPDKFTALRYLAAPPISEDDLDTLLDNALSATALRNNAQLADELVSLLNTSLDPMRFPWIGKRRGPTAIEKNRAQFATAVAATCQGVQTKRRMMERNDLEEDVQTILAELKWKLVPSTRPA